MKRIVTLVVAGLIAGSSMLAAQDLGVGFSRAATAAERQSEGIALRIDLLEVLGESVYVVSTSTGDQVFVSADTGSVEKVENATEFSGTMGPRGGSMGRGGMGAFGSLLEVVDADIDFDQLIETAADEADRDDVRSIGVSRNGSVVVAHVGFGDHSRFALADDDTEPVMVIVDVENNEVIDLVDAGTMGWFAGPTAAAGPQGRMNDRFAGRDTGRDPGRGFQSPQDARDTARGGFFGGGRR